MPAKGDHLSQGTQVLRVATLDRTTFPARPARARDALFEFSSQDRKETPPSLSVFDASLTTPAQAKSMTPTKGEKQAFTLPVAGIIGISLPDGVPPLTVVADPNPELGPGGEGHAGIIGLALPKNFPNGTNIRRQIRFELADMAVAVEG